MMKDNRDFGFKEQIQRTSVPIMNNIAEGYDSGSDTKFINFLNIAKGSCSEVRSMLYLCEDFNYCSTEERLEIQLKIKHIVVGIIKLIDKLTNSPR